MPTVPSENITDADITSAEAAGHWLAQDKEDDVPAAADEQDTYTSEIFGNGVCKFLSQANAVFNGARAILGLAIGDGTAQRAVFDIDSNDLRIRGYDTDGSTLRWTWTIDCAATPSLAMGGVNVSGMGTLGCGAITCTGSSTINGALSVGTATAAGSSQLNVVGGTHQLMISNLETDATGKVGRISVPHYLSAEEPVTVLRGVIASASSVLNWGGSVSNGNAVTQHSFYTAANNTTTSGTERMRIDSDGLVTCMGPTLKIGGTSGPTWTSGTGSPEGAVTAPVGSIYSRTDGGTGTTLYRKESGSGNTGWVATANYWETMLNGSNAAFSVAGTLAGDGAGTTVATWAGTEIQFADATRCATWDLVLPRTYRGGSLVVVLWLYGDGSASAAADMRVSVSRSETGSTYSLAGWATEVSCTGDTMNGTVAVLVQASATISGANLDGLAAGDPYRLRVRRITGDAYTGLVAMVRGLVYEV